MSQNDGTRPGTPDARCGGEGLAGAMTVLIRRDDGGTYYGPIGEYGWRPGDRACSIDRTTCRVEWRPVRRLVRRRNDRRVLRVGLKSGRWVDATEGHGFLTLDAAGDLVRVRLADLAVGTPIPYAGAVPVEPGPPATWVVPEGAKHNAHPSVEFAVDADLGWIHGLYLAEGWITIQREMVRCVSFANVAPEVLVRAGDFFASRRIQALPRSGRDDGRLDRVLVNWKQFGNRLMDDFGNGSYNKHLPGWVLTAGEGYRRGLIAGYLCGDGIYTTQRGRPRIGGGSRSVPLRDGLCDLLATLGIGTTLHEKVVNTGPHGRATNQYLFAVRGEQFHLLPTTGHPRKDALAAAGTWSGKKSADWMPMYPALRRLLVSRTLRSERGRRGRIYYDQHTRTSVAEILGPDAGGRPGDWLRSAAWWDRVTSIRELPAAGHDRVFGIDVGGDAVMCNVGVFVHDSTSRP